MLSFGNLMANVRPVAREGYFTPDARVLLLLPLHHVLPLAGSLMAPLFAGSTIVFATSLAGEELLATLKTHAITTIVGVPRFYDLLHRALRERIDASPIARALFALARRLRSRAFSRAGLRLGAPQVRRRAPASDLRRRRAQPRDRRDVRRARLPHVRGLRDDGVRADDHASRACATIKLGSCGQALDGCEVRIEESGEIVVRGPNVMMGYYGRPDATRAILRDGWLHTGDLGRLDEEGFLYVTGRLKEILVLASGKKVDPATIEAALQAATPAVREAGVFLDGDALHALVVPNWEALPMTDRGTAEAWLRREVLDPYNNAVSPYRRVARLTLASDELPRTRLGKLRRHLLEPIAQRIAQAAAEPDRAAAAGDAVVARLVAFLGQHGHRGVTRGEPSRRRPGHRLAGPRRAVGLRRARLRRRPPRDAAGGVRDRRRPGALRGAVQEGRARAPPRSRGPRSCTPRSDRPSRAAASGTASSCTARASPCGSSSASARAGPSDLPAEPFILAPNHQSYLDGLFVSAYLRPRAVLRTLFYAKERHVRRWWLKFLARRSNTIVISPAEGFLGSLQKLAAGLKRGNNLMIFPEGTRSRDGALGPFKDSYAILARELDVPVVPVVIDGAHAVLPAGRHFPRLLRRISVTYLEAVRPLAGEEAAQLQRARARAHRGGARSRPRRSRGLSDPLRTASRPVKPTEAATPLSLSSQRDEGIGSEELHQLVERLDRRRRDRRSRPRPSCRSRLLASPIAVVPFSTVLRSPSVTTFAVRRSARAGRRPRGVRPGTSRSPRATRPRPGRRVPRASAGGWSPRRRASTGRPTPSRAASEAAAGHEHLEPPDAALEVGVHPLQVAGDLAAHSGDQRRPVSSVGATAAPPKLRAFTPSLAFTTSSTRLDQLGLQLPGAGGEALEAGPRRRGRVVHLPAGRVCSAAQLGELADAPPGRVVQLVVQTPHLSSRSIAVATSGRRSVSGTSPQPVELRRGTRQIFSATSSAPERSFASPSALAAVFCRCILPRFRLRSRRRPCPRSSRMASDYGLDRFDEALHGIEPGPSFSRPAAAAGSGVGGRLRESAEGRCSPRRRRRRGAPRARRRSSASSPGRARRPVRRRRRSSPRRVCDAKARRSASEAGEAAFDAGAPPARARSRSREAMPSIVEATLCLPAVDRLPQGLGRTAGGLQALASVRPAVFGLLLQVAERRAEVVAFPARRPRFRGRLGSPATPSPPSRLRRSARGRRGLFSTTSRSSTACATSSTSAAIAARRRPASSMSCPEATSIFRTGLRPACPLVRSLRAAPRPSALISPACFAIESSRGVTRGSTCCSFSRVVRSSSASVNSSSLRGPEADRLEQVADRARHALRGDEPRHLRAESAGGRRIPCASSRSPRPLLGQARQGVAQHGRQVVAERVGLVARVGGRAARICRPSRSAISPPARPSRRASRSAELTGEPVQRPAAACVIAVLISSSACSIVLAASPVISSESRASASRARRGRRPAPAP